MRRKITITPVSIPVDGYLFNVQVWTSLDGGKTWWYAGIGKYAKSEAEAQSIANEYRKQTMWHGINGDEEIIWEN